MLKQNADIGTRYKEFQALAQDEDVMQVFI
jgi:hypothetical protein